MRNAGEGSALCARGGARAEVCATQRAGARRGSPPRHVLLPDRLVQRISRVTEDAKHIHRRIKCHSKQCTTSPRGVCLWPCTAGRAVGARWGGLTQAHLSVSPSGAPPQGSAVARPAPAAAWRGGGPRRRLRPPPRPRRRARRLHRPRVPPPRGRGKLGRRAIGHAAAARPAARLTACGERPATAHRAASGAIRSPEPLRGDAALEADRRPPDAGGHQGCRRCRL